MGIKESHSISCHFSFRVQFSCFSKTDLLLTGHGIIERYFRYVPVGNMVLLFITIVVAGLAALSLGLVGLAVIEHNAVARNEFKRIELKSAGSIAHI